MSIGVIGGADGPTSIFIATPASSILAAAAVVVVAGAAVCFAVITASRKRKNK